MSQKNTQVILVARPEPGPLQPEKLFEIKASEIPKCEKEGDVVVKVNYLSLDPTMRGWLVFDWRGAGGV